MNIKRNHSKKSDTRDQSLESEKNFTLKEWKMSLFESENSLFKSEISLFSIEIVFTRIFHSFTLREYLSV